MSYEGDEKGLDLSWTSDLRTAWEDRDEDQEPSTEGTDDADQTIGGTTDDDLGTETATFLPASVDPDELTVTQQRIIETAVIQRDGTRYEISAAANASPQYVAQVCGRYLPDHPAAATPVESTETSEENTPQTTLDVWTQDGKTVGGATDDDYGEETTLVGSDDDTPLQRQIKTERFHHPNASYGDIAETVDCSRPYVWETLRPDHQQLLTRETFEDLTPIQQQIIEMVVHQNGLKQVDIAAWHDVSEPYVSRVLSHNSHIVETIANGDSHE